ncbi:hypothetical protein ACFXPY_41520 [Streptomyces sp. NPDC059153]
MSVRPSERAGRTFNPDDWSPDVFIGGFLHSGQQLESAVTILMHRI